MVDWQVLYLSGSAGSGAIPRDSELYLCLPRRRFIQAALSRTEATSSYTKQSESIKQV